MADKKRMDRQAEGLHLRSNRQLLQQAFCIWTTKERGNLLNRVRDQRSLRSALTRWKAAMTTRATHDAQATAFRRASDAHLQAQILARLQATLQQRRNVAQRAEAMDESRLIKLALDRWKARKRQVEDDEKHADAARAFFVQHTALLVWKVELARRRQERWVEQREEERKRQILTCRSSPISLKYRVGLE